MINKLVPCRTCGFRTVLLSQRIPSLAQQYYCPAYVSPGTTAERCHRGLEDYGDPYFFVLILDPSKDVKEIFSFRKQIS